MNHFKYIYLFIFLTSFNSFAQERNWTIEKLKDNKTTVKYELVKETKGTHFYYIAETVANVTLKDVANYFSDTKNHQYFLERTINTKTIKNISDDVWLAYYYFNAPWPLPDSDIVLQINKTEQNNSVIFTASSVTNNYKESDVERMTTYKVIYTFEKINDSTTKITYNADYIPVGNVPKFLIKSWFPEGPANIVRNLGKLKKE